MRTLRTVSVPLSDAGPGGRPSPAQPSGVAASVVPEVGDRDADLGEQPAQDGQGQADDVGRVAVDAVDEPAAEAVDGERAGDPQRLAGGDVGVDLGVGRRRRSARSWRPRRSPRWSPRRTQCPVSRTPSRPRIARQRAVPRRRRPACRARCRRGRAPSRSRAPRPQGSARSAATARALRRASSRATWDGGPVDVVLVDPADHDLRPDAGGDERLQARRGGRGEDEPGHPDRGLIGAVRGPPRAGPRDRLGRTLRPRERHWPRGGSVVRPGSPATAVTTATTAASSSGVGSPRTMRSTGAALRLRLLVVGHRGMFPCFFGGRFSRLVRSARSARMIWMRVCDGSMTAST